MVGLLLALSMPPSVTPGEMIVFHGDGNLKGRCLVELIVKDANGKDGERWMALWIPREWEPKLMRDDLARGLVPARQPVRILGQSDGRRHIVVWAILK